MSDVPTGDPYHSGHPHSSGINEKQGTYYPDGHAPETQHGGATNIPSDNTRLRTANTNGAHASPSSSSDPYSLEKERINANNANNTNAAPAPFASNPNSWGPYGGNPLAQIRTEEGISRLPAFGGEFQPGLYTPQTRFGNPAPLGLCGFAFTTFLLSLINLGTRGLAAPNIIVGPAYAYGGLIQLLAGMWEMAVGNTFGATALTSYGGFWISLAITFTPRGFGIIEAYGGETAAFANAFGLYLIGWFIFTFILWLCTLRSTVAFCSLFLTVWITFLMLGIGYINNTDGAPDTPLIRAGGAFGIVAAFIAWYNAFAGFADSTNSFFVVPVLHFPWSAKRREERRLSNAEKNA